MIGPLLVGERVTLGPIDETMLTTFSRWFADPDVTRFIILRYPPTIDGERDWFKKVSESQTQIIWAVFVGQTPDATEHTRLIGTTGIHNINFQNRRAETGNLIGEKSEWGKGYGSEAVKLRTRWAFGEMGLQKLSTNTFMENFGSRRVLEKSGYKQYGVLRQHEWRGGKWHDMWLADVLADEWRAMQTGEALPLTESA